MSITVICPWISGKSVSKYLFESRTVVQMLMSEISERGETKKSQRHAITAPFFFAFCAASTMAFVLPDDDITNNISPFSRTEAFILAMIASESNEQLRFILKSFVYA